MAIVNGKDADKIALGGELFSKSWIDSENYLSNECEVYVPSISGSNPWNFKLIKSGFTDVNGKHETKILGGNSSDSIYVPVGEIINNGIKYLAIIYISDQDASHIINPSQFLLAGFVKKSEAKIAKWGGKLAYLYTMVKRFAARKAVVAW